MAMPVSTTIPQCLASKPREKGKRVESERNTERKGKGWRVRETQRERGKGWRVREHRKKGKKVGE
jgi:hypothetical protein